MAPRFGKNPTTVSSTGTGLSTELCCRPETGETPVSGHAKGWRYPCAATRARAETAFLDGCWLLFQVQALLDEGFYHFVGSPLAQQQRRFVHLAADGLFAQTGSSAHDLQCAHYDPVEFFGA